MLESLSQQRFILNHFQRLAAVTLSLLVWSCMISGVAAQSVYEPDRGSTERKAVLNAVRPMLEARVGAPVEFVVDWMRLGNGWAFVQLNPQRPGGAPIDLSRTTYREQAEYMDGVATFALLKHQYDRWNLIDFVVGPTDVFWHGDPLYAQLPLGLVPY